MTRSKWVVKDEFINQFYGNTDQETIQDYQTNGIPEEDLQHLEREWGDLSEMLEEL